MKRISEMTQEEKEEIQARSIQALADFDKQYGVTIGEDGIARFPSGKARNNTTFGLQFPLGSLGYPGKPSSTH